MREGQTRLVTRPCTLRRSLLLKVVLDSCAEGRRGGLFHMLRRLE